MAAQASAGWSEGRKHADGSGEEGSGEESSGGDEALTKQQVT
jgi:hypothetical protein